MNESFGDLSRGITNLEESRTSRNPSVFSPLGSPNAASPLVLRSAVRPSSAHPSVAIHPRRARARVPDVRTLDTHSSHDRSKVHHSTRNRRVGRAGTRPYITHRQSMYLFIELIDASIARSRRIRHCHARSNRPSCRRRRRRRRPRRRRRRGRGRS